jgi:RNA polymerase sigma-70 factor (ECF subfamily)
MAASDTAGDDDASIHARAELTSAYWEHYSVLVAQGRQLLGGPGAPSAEDVAQDVFLRLWQDPARYDPAKAPLVSFLRLHVRSRAIEVVRSESARARRELRTCDRPRQEGGDVDPLPRSRMTIVHALGLLTIDQRRLIHLTFYQGYSYRQAAAVLGLPEGTAKSRIRKTLAQLRDLLRSNDGTT